MAARQVDGVAGNDLAGALSTLARAVAGRSKVERKQLAALLESLAIDPDDRAETCEAIASILAPSEATAYVQTWEETAREVAAEVGRLGKPIQPSKLIELVDQAREMGEGSRLAVVGEKKAK